MVTGNDNGQQAAAIGHRVNLLHQMKPRSQNTFKALLS